MFASGAVLVAAAAALWGRGFSPGWVGVRGGAVGRGVGVGWGVQACQGQPDLVVVGVAGDYDGLVAGASAARPNVVVTDVRMPPAFQCEGIEAAREFALHQAIVDREEQGETLSRLLPGGRNWFAGPGGGSARPRS